MPGCPLESMRTAVPAPPVITPLIPAAKNNVCVPAVPMRIVPLVDPVIESVGLINLDLNPITKPGEIDPTDPRYSSSDWRKLTAGATEIPTRYRFRPGSAELDSKGSRDIGRIVGVLSQSKFQNKRVILIGFADSSGTPQANRDLSRKRATIVGDELTPEGLSISETVGLGAEAFVSPNDTAEGREKNRRVEVWVK